MDLFKCKIYIGDSVVTQSNLNGILVLNNVKKKITLRKNYYDDKDIESGEIINNQIIFLIALFHTN
jgi:hypothetical protein